MLLKLAASPFKVELVSSSRYRWNAICRIPNWPPSFRFRFG